MNTAGKIEIMQAYLDGKDILWKYKDENHWRLLERREDDINWDFKLLDYKIK